MFSTNFSKGFAPPSGVNSYKSINYVVSLRLFLFLIFIISSFNAVENCYSQTPIVQNGDFENYVMLPTAWNLPLTDFSISNIPWINRCLGFCQNPNNINMPNPPTNCTGWFIPTFGTADYYNSNAAPGAFHIKVPRIQLCTDGYDFTKTELREPHSGDAYCGLSLGNTMDAAINDYREYLESKLNIALEGNYTYLVKFWVSRSQPKCGNIGHLNKIGAYLSEQAILNFPGYPDEFTEGLYDQYSFNPQTNRYTKCSPQILSTELSATGADPLTGLGGWEEISGTVTVPRGESYNYITIGSFEERLTDFVYDTPPPNNNSPFVAKQAYYFIDDISIEETPCNCGISASNPDGAYTITVVPRLKQPGSESCCYDLYLNKDANLLNICRVNKVELFLGDAIIPFYTYDAPEGVDYFFKGSSDAILVYPNKCFTNLDGTTQTIKIKLYKDNAFMCESMMNFTVNCPCNCESSPPPAYQMSLNLVNYSHSLAKNQCCWEIELKNASDCNFSVKEIYLDIDQNLSSNLTLDQSSSVYWNFESMGVVNVNGINKIRYKLTNPNQSNILEPNVNNQTNIIGKICKPWGSSPFPITFSYSTVDGVCDRQWIKTLDCVDCCEKIHVTVNPIPIMDDGTSCCFQADVLIDPGYQCGTRKIRIFTSGSNPIFLFDSGTDNLPEGLSSYVFCVNKDLVFGSASSIPINVQILNNQSPNEILCVNPATINACVKLPAPCKPDYEGATWSSIQTKMVPVDCPPLPNGCTVEVKYIYRTVEVNGVIITRDIQIVGYSWPTGCPCNEDARVGAMLEAIWSEPLVISAFNLNKDILWPNNSDYCFTNLRVVASDCWYTFNLDPLNIHKVKCNTTSCCYATYYVCYHKGNNGAISYIDGSFRRISMNDYDILPCIDPYLGCEPNNCGLLLHAGHGLFPKPIINANDSVVNQTPCKVYISSDNTHQVLALNLECELKGNVTFQLIDLLGNVAQQEQIVKSGFNASVLIDQKLNSGVYFVRVKFDSQVLYYDKINIVK